MKQVLVLLSIVLLLAACGHSDSSEIKDVIRQNLTGPGSAMFGDIIFSDDRNRACITWTAKNRFGGYDDWQQTELRKDGPKWIMKEWRVINCSEMTFMAEDLFDAMCAEVKALRGTDIGDNTYLNVENMTTICTERRDYITVSEKLNLGTFWKIARDVEREEKRVPINPAR